MKKLFIILLVLAIFFSACSTANTIDHPSNSTNTPTIAVNNETTPTTEPVETPTATENIPQKETVLLLTNYEYNEYGYWGESDISMSIRKEYSYNENGNMTAYSWINTLSASYDLDEKVLREDYSYDYSCNDKGLIVEQNKYYAEGSLASQFEYSYDASGNLIEKTESYDGEVFCTYNYDQNGHLTKTTTAYGDITTYVYNESGDVIRKMCHYEDGSEQIKNCAYQYDNQGRIVQRSTSSIHTNSDGTTYSYVSFETYTYDDLNQTITSKLYGEDSSEPTGGEIYQFTEIEVTQEQAKLLKQAQEELLISTQSFY